METLNAELVIVGGGGTGLAAALSAYEHGVNKIMVLEKAGSPGGSSAMAHDLFGVGSPVQKRKGTDARAEDFFKIAMRWSHWSKVNPRLVRAFIDKSGDTIRWMEEKGVRFNLGQFYVNQSPRIRHTIEGRGAEMMRILAAHCRERGIQILTRTPANKVIRGKENELHHVLAKSAESEYDIAAKCVIFASGGYAANQEMLARYCSFYNPEVAVNQGPRGNTGDGIKMAVEIGAATASLGNIMFHGPHAFPLDKTSFSIINDKGETKVVAVNNLVCEPQALWVNKRGRRFVDEGYNLSSFAHATVTAQQPGGIMFALYDQQTLQFIEENGLIRPMAYGDLPGLAPPERPMGGQALPGFRKVFLAGAAKSPYVKISESLDEIAAWIGAKPEVLKATRDEYNTMCEKGRDGLFGKDYTYLIPLKTPPFAAIRGQACICDAIGGIKINENMEVVDSEDEAIPGFYAGGSTSGGWETENYCYELTGHLLGFAVNSGRIAGENAAAYIKK
jgi:fumarate reductase flavoprotein subunit